jgi:hypothetical protein
MSRLMRRLWAGGLSLGLMATAAPAGEVTWRPAGDGQREVIASTTAAGRTPAAALGRPIAVAPADPLLRPASFSAPVVRGNIDDAPKELPVGPPEPGKKVVVKASNEALPPPRLVPHPPGGPVPDPSPDGCVPCPPVCCEPCPPVRCRPWRRLFCGRCETECPEPCCDEGLFGEDGCCGQASQNRFWLSGEYLMWWVRGNNLPALVTMGSFADNFPGALGQPRTVTLFGGGYVDDDTRHGARFRTGWWFNDEHTCGLEGSFFFLGQRGVNFAAGSPGDPALFRPFFNPGVLVQPDGTTTPIPPTEDAQFVSVPPGAIPTIPGGVSGTVSVSLTSRLWGGDVNLRKNLWCGLAGPLDCLLGFRYLGLDEKLSVTENLATNGAPFFGFSVTDSFQTKNRFYGGQIGLDKEFRFGRWFLDVRTLVGLGNMHQVVNIQGTTVINDPSVGLPMVAQGGLLAQRTNIGRYDRNRFAVIPEVGLNLGYQVTDWLRLYAGYNFLYVSNVVRPGQQIDRAVNPTLLPGSGVALSGPARPLFRFEDTDFWAHGVNFGMEFRY